MSEIHEHKSFVDICQSMEPISIDDLKREKCPRISAEDLIELGELRGAARHTKSPTKRKQSSKPLLLAIDVRSEEEYPFNP